MSVLQQVRTETKGLSETSTPTASFDVFLTPEALAINEARLCHLASLGLDLKNKRVLEVGGGIGLHTCFFESQGCDVLFTEARPDNLEEARRRYPHRKTAMVNLDTASDLSRLGRFDIVYCYGTLYHLSNPSNALRILSQICDEMILVETCVTPGDDEQLHPEAEPSSVANQAFTGIGCRPTRAWVMRELRSHMGFAYQTATQPHHHDFEPHWLKPTPRKLYRAVFVGAKAPLANRQLSETPCALQASVPNATRGVWFDVGAHLGETTFASAEANPGIQVYAFEPNIALANHTFHRIPNFHVLPLAVGEQNGLATFHLNSFAAASSMLPMDESARREWVGGEVLSQDSRITVPVMRLDAIMDSLGIERIDFLKIDAQGGDFAVVKSAGKRLRDIRKIKLEVTTTPQQLYVGAGTKTEIVRYMSEHGFALVSEQSQTHGQEENLTFFKLGPWEQGEYAELIGESFHDENEIRNCLAQASDAELVRIATRSAPSVALERVPGWTFGRFAEDPSAACRFRRALCDAFRERKLLIPVVFPWYHDLKLNLYLGNDVSLPTFVSGGIDPNEFCFLSRFLKRGMTFVDVGANEGLYAVFAARCVGSEGRVIAFEPSQREAERLKRNLELNQLANVTLEPVGVADSDGQAVLKICEYGHEGQNTLGGFVYQVGQEGTQTIGLCRLDTYRRDRGLSRLDFIKIDMEGAEERVLQGAAQTLKTFRPLIQLEMNDQALQLQGSSRARVARWLLEADYRICSIDAATGLFSRTTEDQFSDNVLAIPAEKMEWLQAWNGISS